MFLNKGTKSPIDYQTNRLRLVGSLDSSFLTYHAVGAITLGYELLSDGSCKKSGQQGCLLNPLANEHR